MFAISTAISWSYYGDRSANYLFGKKATVPYKWVYVLFVFIGAIAQLEAVWAFGDAALGFMTFPNLISIILLSGVLKKMSKDYFSVKHVEYKKLIEKRNKTEKYNKVPIHPGDTVKILSKKRIINCIIKIWKKIKSMNF